MNIKLDENLPERLVTELQKLGHNVDTVRAEGLAGRDDRDIWQAAQPVDRFLITQDLHARNTCGIAACTSREAWSGCFVGSRVLLVRDGTGGSVAWLSGCCY